MPSLQDRPYEFQRHYSFDDGQTEQHFQTAEKRHEAAIEHAVSLVVDRAKERGELPSQQEAPSFEYFDHGRNIGLYEMGKEPEYQKLVAIHDSGLDVWLARSRMDLGEFELTKGFHEALSFERRDYSEMVVIGKRPDGHLAVTAGREDRPAHCFKGFAKDLQSAFDLGVHVLDNWDRVLEQHPADFVAQAQTKPTVQAQPLSPIEQKAQYIQSACRALTEIVTARHPDWEVDSNQRNYIRAKSGAKELFSVRFDSRGARLTGHYSFDGSHPVEGWPTKDFRLGKSGMDVNRIASFIDGIGVAAEDARLAEQSRLKAQRERHEAAADLGLAVSSAKEVPGVGFQRQLHRVNDEGKVIESATLTAETKEKLASATEAAAQYALKHPTRDLKASVKYVEDLVRSERGIGFGWDR